MTVLPKVKSGMDSSDWRAAMHSLPLQTLQWPGHAGVRGNEWQIDWQAQQTSQPVSSLDRIEKSLH